MGPFAVDSTPIFSTQIASIAILEQSITKERDLSIFTDAEDCRYQKATHKTSVLFGAVF